MTPIPMPIPIPTNISECNISGPVEWCVCALIISVTILILVIVWKTIAE